MGTDGVAGKEDRFKVKVHVLDAQHSADMEYRPRDVAICHLLEDARESGDEIVLIGRNVFREDKKRPRIDEITVSDVSLAALLPP